jgi:excisionase family DNA binding protein
MTANAKTKGILNGMTIAASVWLTASEAAQYLRVEPRTLLMWARQGRVKGYVLSGTQRVTWRFRAEDLDATMSPPSVALRNGRIQ